MGCLYIGGAQCTFAEFLASSDVQVFDSQKKRFSELAAQFNIHVARKKIEDPGSYCFVLMNEEPRTERFYDGAAFEVNMSVNASDTFHTRALAYVDAINKNDAFTRFHNMQWNGPKVLYFVSS